MSAATSSAKQTGSGASSGSAAVVRRWRREATWLRSDAAPRISTPRQLRQRSARPGSCFSLGASSQFLRAASRDMCMFVLSLHHKWYFVIQRCQ